MFLCGWSVSGTAAAASHESNRSKFITSCYRAVTRRTRAEKCVWSCFSHDVALAKTFLKNNNFPLLCSEA